MASASAGNPQSNNLYSYTQNNPVDFVDPSGLNASSTGTIYYACYDVITWRDGVIVDIQTVCHFFGGGGNGGGGNLGGGTETPITVDNLVDNAKKIINNSSDECKAMFAKNDALKKLDELKKKGKIKTDGSVLFPNRAAGFPGGGPPMIPLSKSGVSGTVIKGNIEINPKRNPMTKESYGGLSGREVDNWKSRGASPLDVTTATLMHELLHITKYFKPDGDYDESGKPQKSIDNQAELEKKCFPKKEGQN